MRYPSCLRVPELTSSWQFLRIGIRATGNPLPNASPDSLLLYLPVVVEKTILKSDDPLHLPLSPLSFSTKTSFKGGTLSTFTLGDQSKQALYLRQREPSQVCPFYRLKPRRLLLTVMSVPNFRANQRLHLTPLLRAGGA